MHLLRRFSLDMFFLLTIFSLIDASALAVPNESASAEKSCLNYCSNNGICEMTGNGPKCYCLLGWKGTRCNDIRERDANPEFYFFKNTQSSSRINLCPASFPTTVCKNDGACIISDTNQVGCICKTDSMGTFCENKLECPAGFCQSGGTCIPNIDPDIVPTCICTSEYSGVICQNKITTTITTTKITTTMPEVCQFNTNYCKNGGTCDFTTEFICHCPPTHEGPTCEQLVGVAPSPAPNTPPPSGPSTPAPSGPSTPVPSGPSTPVPSGPSTPSTTSGQQNTPTFGKTCADRPCRNDRPCFNTGDSYFCYCGPAFGGPNCEQVNNG